MGIDITDVSAYFACTSFFRFNSDASVLCLLATPALSYCVEISDVSVEFYASIFRSSVALCEAEGRHYTPL